MVPEMGHFYPLLAFSGGEMGKMGKSSKMEERDSPKMGNGASEKREKIDKVAKMEKTERMGGIRAYGEIGGGERPIYYKGSIRITLVCILWIMFDLDKGSNANSN